MPRNVVPEGVNHLSGEFAQNELICQFIDMQQEVVQLAYGSAFNTSCENPLADLLKNLSPAVQLFSEAANRGVRFVLAPLDATVYGEWEKFTLPETHPTTPISPYGITKLTLEHYAYLYTVTCRLKFVCFCSPNANGVGQRSFVGQGFVASAIAADRLARQKF